MKKVLSIMLCIMLAISCLTVTALTASADTTPRYTVLLLDVSGSMGSDDIAAEKAAALKFCQTATAASSENKVAVARFSSTARTICDFTNDIDTLSAAIDSIYAFGGTNFIAAFELADELLDAEAAKGVNFERNVVFCSDGLPQSGDYSDEGEYTIDDNRYYYDYANAALEYDKNTLWPDTNVYTIGFFQNLTGEDATFAPRFMADLANQKSVVTDNVDDLIDVFEDFAEEITKEETPDEPATADEPTSSTNSTSSKTNQNPSNAADIARAIETSDSVGFYGILALSFVAFGAMAFVSKRRESAEK